ncbi:hypothetical protein D3C77_689510 [compost metagenome]
MQYPAFRGRSLGARQGAEQIVAQLQADVERFSLAVFPDRHLDPALLIGGTEQRGVAALDRLQEELAVFALPDQGQGFSERGHDP